MSVDSATVARRTHAGSKLSLSADAQVSRARRIGRSAVARDWRNLDWPNTPLAPGAIWL